jgi:AraC-like DNA-binding protein
VHTVSYIPQVPLSHYVDVIWFSEAGTFDYRNLTLPMLHHELIVNFSDRFEISDGRQTLVANVRAWLSGLQTRPIHTLTGGRHYTAGVLFKPWGLYACLGINAETLKDSSVELERIIGAPARQLIDDIYLARTPREVLQRMEGFLTSRLSGHSLPVYLLPGISLMDTYTLSDAVVEKLSGRFGISAKTLIQHFRKYVGLTPVRYHHLRLLNRLLQHLTHHPDRKLTDTGYELDFFDQAHFIHFFRKYTGFSPSAYLRQFAEGKITPAAPNSIQQAFSGHV